VALTEAVAAIEGLEENWDGSIEANTHIAETLRALEASGAPAEMAGNGRFESLLYRAVYDDFVQRKLKRERGAEAAAMDALSKGGSAEQRVQRARGALGATRPDAVETREHEQLFSLADALFHDWGLQLSVDRHHAENWERGANLDRVDTPLTDAAWLNQRMEESLKQPTEAARLAALEEITHWSRPVPGALYDDLGDPEHEPHLVRGKPWPADPEMYDAAIDSIADRTLGANPSPANETTPMPEKGRPWRLSWIDYAETLYETPLTLRYSGLDPRRHYTARVTYAGEDYALPLRLTANGLEVHPARLRSSNPETVEFALPAAALRHGSLTLRWTGPSGSGGSGRGRQVAEVWLLPKL
jgi:hypothetical protein